jgi:hypothetical protein
MTRRAAVVGVLALLALALATPASALELHKVARFRQPVDVTAPRGDRRELFVVERTGRIEVVRHGRRLRRPFLDIRGLVDLDFPNDQFRDQSGLASLAFAPDYRRSGRFYVFYSHRGGTLHVDEFRRRAGSPLRAARDSRRTLIAIPRYGRRVDLGGDLGFGPDGYLYIGFGEGASRQSAQDLGVLTGKILRIDPTPGAGTAYGIAPGNPFAAVPDTRPEIWALGLRMPWRFSFDPRSGDLIVGEVGEDSFEEVDVLGPADAGANLGWPFYEGRQQDQAGAPGGLSFPALAKPHAHGTCAIVGGYLIRGRRLPALRNRYLYGDVCTGRLRSVRLAGGDASGDRSEHSSVPYLDSFGRDGRGRLYAVSLDGPVYRIVDRGPRG